MASRSIRMPYIETAIAPAMAMQEPSTQTRHIPPNKRIVAMIRNSLPLPRFPLGPSGVDLWNQLKQPAA